MSQEFYDIQLTISELKEKLKLIKATLKPLIHNGKVPPGLIPYDIREEIVKIYDEHGGILKLAEWAKIDKNAIIHMHRCWSRDPYIYKRNSNSKPRSKGRKLDIIIKKLISKPLKDETQVNTEIKRKKIITDESTTVEKLTNEIDVKLEKNILEIKELIRDKLVSGKGLDIEVKKKVLDFYKQIGDIRKSSILLGISERMITNWNSEQIHRDQNTIEIE